jgi:hypothetical protein
MESVGKPRERSSPGLSFLIRPANQPAASLEIVFCGFMVMWSLSFQGWDPEDLRTCLKGYFLTLTSKP